MRQAALFRDKQGERAEGSVTRVLVQRAYKRETEGIFLERRGVYTTRYDARLNIIARAIRLRGEADGGVGRARWKILLFRSVERKEIGISMFAEKCSGVGGGRGVSSKMF